MVVRLISLSDSLFQVLALSTVLSVCAKTIVVTVGGGSNTTQDASAVFKPQTVVAARGDLVFFNCKPISI